MLGTTEIALPRHYWLMGKKRRAEPIPRWFAREWLEFTGIKPKQIVEHTGWSKGQVSELINMKERWNGDTLYKFSEVIGCPPGALVDIDPSTERGRLMAQLLMVRGKAG